MLLDENNTLPVCDPCHEAAEKLEGDNRERFRLGLHWARIREGRSNLYERAAQTHHRGVTGELTTITGDFDANPETPDETLSLFDDALYGYFWEYDGSGLRRVQLRFQSVY